MKTIRITWKRGEGQSGMCGQVQDWVPDHGKEKELLRFKFRGSWMAFTVYSARTLQLVFGLWLHPSWWSGLSSEHELQFRSWGLLTSVLVYAHSVWLTVSSQFHPRTPLDNPYREPHTPLLSVSALRSCFSLALGLFIQSALIWKQVSLPVGLRPSWSSH